MMGSAGDNSGGLEARTVRYRDLRPCFNAFIDSRTPGSESKENFTIIGPGVSENPEQFVHLPEPHGFNIGGARQPPGCVNSQHSHDTAEVFVVHSGHWRINVGERGDDAQVTLHPGDVASIPTGLFRGFTNVGDDTGFLWVVLGSDDPGRVLWAPYVFDMASDYGLVLLDSGRLVDTVAGQQVPDGARPMPRTTSAQVAAMAVPTSEELEGIVVRDDHGAGPRIGPDAPLAWPHGFTLSRYEVAPGDAPLEAAGGVFFVHRGTVTVRDGDDCVSLSEGDTISVPAASAEAQIVGGATLFEVRRA